MSPPTSTTVAVARLKPRLHAPMEIRWAGVQSDEGSIRLAYGAMIVARPNYGRAHASLVGLATFAIHCMSPAGMAPSCGVFQ